MNRPPRDLRTSRQRQRADDTGHRLGREDTEQQRADQRADEATEKTEADILEREGDGEPFARRHDDAAAAAPLALAVMSILAVALISR